ncbi:FKBP-type peptidyl-prolyl cis-trans isomerase [Larkinella arboricola]
MNTELRQLGAGIMMALLLVVSLSACNKNNFIDPSPEVARENDQQIRDYLNANKLLNRVTPTTTGLYYLFTDTTSTRNKKPQYNEELEFTFALSYIAGTKAILLDSTKQTRSTFIPFLRGMVVPGLEEGLLLMQEGQRAMFFMPSARAFGQGKKDTIPANVPVVFDVALIRSRTEAEQIQEYVTRKKLGIPTFKPSAENTGDSVWVYRLSQGTGPKVTEDKTVTVAYTATTLRGSAPFAKQDAKEIRMGATPPTDVAGLVTGLTALNVGDKALLIFPSSLGYGAQGINDQTNYIVTPYAPLVYEVTVKSMK